MYHSWIKVCYNFHKQNPFKKKKVVSITKTRHGTVSPLHMSV